MQKKKKNPDQEFQNQLKSARQNRAFFVTGLNLLSNFKRPQFIPEDVDKVTLLLRNLTIFISIMFSLVIISNFTLLFSLDNLKTKQSALIDQINLLSDIDKTAKYVDRKVTYFKKLLAVRKNISPKIKFVSSKFGEDINVNDIRYTGSLFRMYAEGPDAYTFTRLISEYLKGDVISEISIQGARLNTRTGKFEIDMEGKFK